MTAVIDRILDPYLPEEQVQEYIFEDVDLGGESWNYRLFWNDRAERWQLDVWTSELGDDGKPTKAVYGTRAVPAYPLNFNHTGRIPPDGAMVLIDTADPSSRDQCTYDGLGHRWQLAWVIDDGVEEPDESIYVITVPTPP
jgi:hypothetical protein